MAVTFFPFNSIVVDGVPDRPANAENLAAYLAGFFSNGVLMQTDTALKVEASSGMNVQIHAGMGNINGKTILADAAEIITLDTASASLARIDRVVFRLDEVNRLMEFDVLKGTPASSPAAPALTQGADVYELCLAEIRVPAGATSIAASYITDTRADADLCGVASIAPHMQDLEHGGTGISAETKEALLLALGGANIKEVWANASVLSTFEAQNVKLSLNEGDLVMVEYIMLSTSSYHDIAIATVTEQTPILGSVVFGTSSKVTGYYRGATIYPTHIQFNSGWVAQASSDTENNGAMIPYKIFIIKRGVQ